MINNLQNYRDERHLNRVTNLTCINLRQRFPGIDTLKDMFWAGHFDMGVICEEMSKKEKYMGDKSEEVMEIEGAWLKKEEPDAVW